MIAMVGASMMWQEFRTYSREALIAFYEEAIKGPASDYLVEGSKELRAWMLRGLGDHPVPPIHPPARCVAGRVAGTGMPGLDFALIGLQRRGRGASINGSPA